MKSELRERLHQARGAGRPVALLTALPDGAQALVFEDEAVAAGLDLPAERLDEARRMLAEGRSGLLSGGEAEPRLFARVYASPWRLFVVGAVHVAQTLAPMAAMAGWEVVVIDPRGAFASDARFPGQRIVRLWADEAFAAERLDRRSAVVTLTHDPKLDDPALEAALRSPAFYIGALGSRRTHARRVARLVERGFSEAEIARIHAPVGLDLGGRAPAEIAVAALAEVIRTRYGAGPKG